MKNNSLAFLLTLLIAFPAFATDKPPATYIDKGACPFDGCMYGEWDVLKETKLYDAPDSNKLVGVAHSGEKVTGVTGKVQVSPGAIKILQDHPPYKAGDMVYPLTYYGEGEYLVWFHGKTSIDETIYEALDEEGQKGIGPNAKGRDWAKLIEQPRQGDWWVKVKLPDGITGWSREYLSAERNFCNKGNNDNCMDAY